MMRNRFLENRVVTIRILAENRRKHGQVVLGII
jgi:hypothetical protein